MRSPSSPHGRRDSKIRVCKAAPVSPPCALHPWGAPFRALPEGGTVNDLYALEQGIYDGTGSRVVAATRRSDGAEVVVKIRSRRPDSARSEQAWRSKMCRMHKMGRSRHVLGITEIVESPDDFYIVMPRCSGGELFEFITADGDVAEAECQQFIRDILLGIDHLHRHGFIHRDIKPENVMLDWEPDSPGGPKRRTAKLIDFDTCLDWSPGTTKCSNFVGTPGYIAPEGLLGKYSPQSDLWSVGVILYNLMVGTMPWAPPVPIRDGRVGSPGAVLAYDNLRTNAPPKLEDEPWVEFTEARDLCRKLLGFRPADRPQTAEEALAHPWLLRLHGGGGIGD